VPADLFSVVQVVRSDAFAGVERYMCQVANGLASRGHRLTVIGGDPGRMRSELSDQVDHREAATVIQAARALAGQRHADVVHVHMTAAEGAAWLARPFQRAPIVATRHFPGERGRGRVARSLAHLAARSIARDIAISRFVADRVSGPTVLLRNAVPDQAQADLELPTVLMLQRLTEEKSPELGLRIWAESGLGTAGWRLVVAGTGDRQRAMRELTDELGLDDSVEFVGQRSDTDRLLDQSSVVLATAPEEPFGLSVVEAMAHGVPVVAAEGGGHVETMGHDGMLFPPGDARAASGALVQLAADRDLRRRVGERLRERQRRMFSLGQHLEGLERLYGEVIEEHRRR
jgi:glycosyltransferase involved in cell wall biosynthesis